MQEIEGLICAALTPFVSSTGFIDETWVETHLRFLEAHGIDGVLILGTTGEGPSLSLAERVYMIDLILEHRGNLSVLACTGCAALPDTIALSRYALERGVDGVLVMPPFYFKHVPEQGVLDYFRALCDALPETARVLLYHIPDVTGVPIAPGVIEGLLESHKRQFYGLKDSSGDTYYLMELLSNHPQLRVLVGNEHQMFHGLSAGAAGVISALSNVWPGVVRAVIDAHAQGGDVATAQARLSELCNLLAGNTAPLLKVALPWTSTLTRTAARVPLSDLSEAESAHFRTDLERLGFV